MVKKRNLQIITINNTLISYDSLILDLLNDFDNFFKCDETEDLELFKLTLKDLVCHTINNHFKKDIYSLNKEMKIVGSITDNIMTYDKDKLFILKDIWDSKLKKLLYIDNLFKLNITLLSPEVLNILTVHNIGTGQCILIDDEFDEKFIYLLLRKFNIKKDIIVNKRNLNDVLFFKIDEISDVYLTIITDEPYIEKKLFDIMLDNRSKKEIECITSYLEEKIKVSTVIISHTNYALNLVKEKKSIVNTAVVKIFDIHKFS